ncbi:MAG: hypothetical protein M0R02_07735 [Bacteroidales bacterium]|nr:hypothetical protein [Bacteroidales bacterium]
MNTSKIFIQKLRYYIVLAVLCVYTCNMQQAKAQADNSISDEEEKAHSLLETVKQSNKFIQSLDSLNLLDFPVGIALNNSKDAQNYAIIISEMEVENEQTFLTAYMSFTIPGTTQKIAFKGSRIPFSFAGGLQGDARLTLISEHTIPITKDIQLRFTAGGGNYITWDCMGFKEMHTDIQILFNNKVFVPENPDGSLKDPPLTTTINTTLTHWNDFIVAVSLEPFQIKGLTGVGFSIEEATIDFSNAKNPEDMKFPTLYEKNTYYANSIELWQGIYIKNAQIRMPPQFKTKSSQQNRLTFSAHNMIIDEQGFTGVLQAYNLFSLEEGSMSGWGYSLDEFGIEIQSNVLVGAGFSGMLSVPYLGESSVMHYNATLGLHDSYNFSISMVETASLDMWASTLKIHPSSILQIDVQKGEFIPSLLLHGELNVNAPIDNSNTNAFSIVDIAFENMLIETTAPYFSVGTISFGKKQNKFSSFPISITGITIINQEQQIGLQVQAQVNFVGESDGGFGGTTGITVWATKTEKPWEYSHVDIDNIIVHISKGNAFTLDGEVAIVRSDPEYGNGFNGTLAASFGGFSMSATALFGSIDNFRYWYADALISKNVAIATVGPIGLYGLGGGLYFKMRQEIASGAIQSGIGISNSGLKYVPDKQSKLGFKASVIFGLAGSPQAFNGDLEYNMSFLQSGGIDKVSLVGNGYFMNSDFSTNSNQLSSMAKNVADGKAIPINNSKAQVYANVAINYDIYNSVFHANFNTYVNVGGVIKGAVNAQNLAGYGVMHFDKNDWYIQIGKPESPNSLSMLNLATTESYFMTGKSIGEIPPPPTRITNLLDITTVDKTDNLLLEGKGFMFGTNFLFDTGDIHRLIFLGRFGCQLGFNLMLKNYELATCTNRSSIGINNWYAKGNAYAWIKALIGLQVTLPFYHGKYTIFDIEGASVLQVEGPNPIWLQGSAGGNYNILNGAVKGHCNFVFEIGEKCQMVSNNPLGGIAIIGDITPLKNDSKVNTRINPQASFNMAVGKSFEIETDDKTKTFRIVLQQFTITDKHNNPIQGSISWNDNNDVCVFTPHDILPGKATLTITVEVSFEEFVKNSWQVVYHNNKKSTEKITYTFTTDKQPDDFEEKHVAISYPGVRAINYYKSESSDNFIELNQGQPNIFVHEPGWEIKGKLTTLSDNSTQYIAIKYDNSTKKISYNLPSQLRNNELYRFEIVKRSTSTADVRIDDNVEKVTRTQTIADNNDEITVDINEQKITENLISSNDKIIYITHFRTSNWDSWKTKIEQNRTVSSNFFPILHTGQEKAMIQTVEGEILDMHEVESLTHMYPILTQGTWSEHGFKDFEAAAVRMGHAKFKPSSGCSNFHIDLLKLLTDDDIHSGTYSNAKEKYYIYNLIILEIESYHHHVANNIANAYIDSGDYNTFKSIYSYFYTNYYNATFPVSVDYTVPYKKTASSAQVLFKINN